MKEDKITSQPIRVLLVEDDSADQSLTKHALAKSTYGSFEFNCMDTLKKGIEFAALGQTDVVLLDLNLPDSSGVDTFQIFKLHVTKIPIVVLSGLSNKEESLKAVRLGAQDYLIKDHIEGDLLGRSLIYAIERKKAEIKLLESEENFRNSMDNSPMGIRIVDQNWNTVYANPVILNMLGYKNINEVPRNPLYAHYTAQERERAKARGEKLAKGEPLQTDIEVDIIDKDGAILHSSFISR